MTIFYYRILPYRLLVIRCGRSSFSPTPGEACEKTNWQVHAFCLMSNHFHLVLEPPSQMWSQG